MITKEEILALARQSNGTALHFDTAPNTCYSFTEGDLEVFYHAARKPLEEKVERLRVEKAEAVEKMHDSANQFVEFVHGDHSKLATERDEFRQQLALHKANAQRFIAADKAMQDQLAEKDAEIERLKEEGNMPVKYYQPNGKGQVYAVYGSSSINFADLLLEQLAAAQADNERLLSVLCEIAGSKSLTATPTQFYQHLQRVASDGTMGPPSDTSALEAMTRKAGEVMRERCVEEIRGVLRDEESSLDYTAASEVQHAIRVMPGVTIGDL